MLSKIELLVDGKIELSKALEIPAEGIEREKVIGAFQMTLHNTFGLILANGPGQAMDLLAAEAQERVADIQRQQKEK